MWWHPDEFQRKWPYLQARSRIIRSIRAHFDGQGFLEVETPILQVCPVMDAHIRAFGTDLKGVDGKVERHMYLHTSPEFAMKKLMVAGAEKLYQICHVFRNGEGSKRHSPEFTMIEWYRTQADYRDIMRDCEELLRRCAKDLGIERYKYGQAECNPFQDWEYLSVCEAFDQYAGIDLGGYVEDTAGFRQAIADTGIRVAEDDDWDDLFFRVMDAKIEPYLGMTRPSVLYDYPVCMASLSRRKAEDPRFAERFELYVCGLELANAFSELTDAQEQKDRFREEMDIKERIYGERYPVDEDFITALEHGMPESGGIALGIDRLVMLATGAQDIQDVIWAPV